MKMLTRRGSARGVQDMTNDYVVPDAARVAFYAVRLCAMMPALLPRLPAYVIRALPMFDGA